MGKVTGRERAKSLGVIDEWNKRKREDAGEDLVEKKEVGPLKRAKMYRDHGGNKKREKEEGWN